VSLLSSRRAKRKDVGIYRPVGFTSVHGQVMEELNVETFFRHRKDKKVIWNSRHGFMKRK